MLAYHNDPDIKARYLDRVRLHRLVDETHGVVRHAIGRPDCEAAIRRVAELWRNGGTPAEFRQARAASAACASAAAAADAACADAAGKAKGEWVTAACDKLIALLESTGGGM